jgi:hypothetical protein
VPTASAQPLNLTFSGASQGHVSSAEVKECGVNGPHWALEMSNIALSGGTGSLSLYVDSFSQPATYAPRGSLMLIENRQAVFFTITAGTVYLTNAGSGTLNLDFRGPGTVHVSGTWTCPP